MQSSSRAPVLSATRRRDSCWITGEPPGDGSPPLGCEPQARQGRSLRSGWTARAQAGTQHCAAARAPEVNELSPGGSPSGLHDLCQPPALRLRQRTGLDDAHDVARLRRVALVVGMELGRAADHLLVARVRAHGLDLDHDRLVHRGRDDDAAALLAPAALVLGLREPRDRLALALHGGVCSPPPPPPPRPWPRPPPLPLPRVGGGGPRPPPRGSPPPRGAGAPGPP